MLKIYLYISQPYLEVILSVWPQRNGKGRPNPSKSKGGPEDVLVRKEKKWMVEEDRGRGAGGEAYSWWWPPLWKTVSQGHSEKWGALLFRHLEGNNFVQHQQQPGSRGPTPSRPPPHFASYSKPWGTPIIHVGEERILRTWAFNWEKDWDIII